jgi:hypothetical protein
MLQLRPICEHCAKPLPPAAEDARICSFECTFCANCVDEVLQGVCPNCGGGFAPRPVRPARNWVRGNYLGEYPPQTQPRHRPVDAAAHALLLQRLAGLPPAER